MLSCSKINNIVTCCLFFIISTGQAMAADIDYASIINISGSQRMLTQRMLRDYVLVGMGVTFQDPAKDLATTAERFNTQLATLSALVVNDEVSRDFEKVGVIWQEVKPILQTKPDKKTAPVLAVSIENLLKASNEAVLALQKASGKKRSEVVNKSGRQRMLSQRMAALYSLVLWDIPDSDFYEQYRQVVNEYRTIQNYLITSDQTTPAIKAELTKASKLFRWFSKVAAKKSSRLTPEVIQRNSDGLLKIMQKVTSMYVAG